MKKKYVIVIIIRYIKIKAQRKEKHSVDKLWIVFLFLGVFLLINNFAKRFLISLVASQKCETAVFVSEDEEADPKIFWEKEGFRREPEQADFVLPEEDFFENEKTEFSEIFEEEFSGLSEAEANKILEEAGIFEKEGEF